MEIRDILKGNIEFLDKLENSCDGFEKECDSFFSEIEKSLDTGNVDFFDPQLPGNPEPNMAIKKEAEDMPAPTKLPPRRKKIKAENLELPKRATRSRTRNKENDSKESRSSKKTSDVIFESVPVTTIELSDSEKETESEVEAEKTTAAVRTTRSKVKKQNEVKSTKGVAMNEKLDQADGKNERSTRTKRKKRARSDSPETPAVDPEKKKPRSNSGGEKANGTAETENQEPAETQINATYIASPKESNADTTPSMNSTMVVENPKVVLREVQLAQTREDVSPEPPRKTTAAVKKVHKHKEPPEHKNNQTLTPVVPRFQPKVCSTSLVNKLHPSYGAPSSACNESVLSAKSASALKASQAEFRERERLRQEKEREAARKREALLQAQMEERRRRLEERQQRACQQHLELLERERQRQAELQRVKEEKHNQALAEREEKLQKQREEAERKRLQAKKAELQQREREEEMKRCSEARAAAEKQTELARQAHKEKLNAQQQQMPVYMMTKAPLLPTEDCYDSDDPEYEHARRVEPSWSRGPELEMQQVAMIVCGESIKNSFFCRQTHTPDLREIFENIDPRKLKRTSSAIWRKPPRYTLMPNLDESMFSKESD